MNQRTDQALAQGPQEGESGGRKGVSAPARIHAVESSFGASAAANRGKELAPGNQRW